MRQDMEMEDKDSGHLRCYFSWQFHMFKLFFQMSCQENVDRRIIYLSADIIIQHLNLPGQDIDSGNHLVLSYSCPLDSSARR